jgi:Tfp pilus assembly protein PilF
MTGAKTLAAANKALSLDKENVEAQVALANMMSDQFRYDESERLFKEAIALNPSFATAYQWYGNSLGFRGKPEAGLVLHRKAWDLDPRSRIIGANLAWALSSLGRYPESIAVLEKVLDFAPQFPDVLEQLLHNEATIGNCSNVASYGDKLARVLNKKSNTTAVYMALCQRSDSALRARAIETILSWPPLNFADPENPGLSYEVELVNLLVRLGESEAALVLLENNIQTIAPLIFSSLRMEQTENSIAFFCDARVQSLFEKNGVPVLEAKSTCD